MRTPVKLAAYGGALVVAFAAALGAGSVIGGPVAATTSTDGAHGENHAQDAAEHADAHAAGDAATEKSADSPGGLMISDGGYTLDLDRSTLAAGTATPLEFRIADAEGEPVKAYKRSHDKDLHLIAVRRDTTGFQHVHPTLGDDGTWSVPLDLSPGTWRVFADFVPADGKPLTLGADVFVAGDFQPAPLPPASRTAEVDGYTVTLDGDLAAGRESELTLTVSREGEPVTDLQPYLGAYGHLVALRAGDLAYLHVHPAGAPGDGQTQPGPAITFYATAPSTGDYRLYLDFQHGGVVRTAEFTATAGETTAEASGENAGGGSGDTTGEDSGDHEHGEGDPGH